MWDFKLILERVSNFLWGPVMIMTIIGIGLYLMIKLRFLPLRQLGFGMKSILKKEEGTGAGTSAFSALAMELACTIGTGNIIGVTSALLLGGPGALVWMNLSALIGMATKLVESSLSVKYHQKNENGAYVGGPMYVAKQGIPVKRLGSALGFSFAFFCVLSSFGVGNLTQVNSIAGSMESGLDIPPLLTGVVVGGLCILILVGGVQAIARIACLLVPFMGILYLAGALWVIWVHKERLPVGIMEMFLMAFTPRAAMGGTVAAGFVMLGRSIRWGVSRGVFSNEAGLGASGISAASVGTEDYVRQGYVSMTSVFFDTILICTITGLVLICSGVLEGAYFASNSDNAAELTIRAFETALGSTGGIFIGLCISLFAFATIIGWAYQGEQAFIFLMGSSRYIMVYRMLYGIATVFGAVLSLDLVWTMADILNALMAIPNLICVVLLHQGICRDIEMYNYKDKEK